MNRRDVLKIGFLAGINLALLGCSKKNVVNGFLNGGESRDAFDPKSKEARDVFNQLNRGPAVIGPTPAQLKARWKGDKEKYAGKPLYPDDLLYLGENSILPTYRTLARAYDVQGIPPYLETTEAGFVLQDKIVQNRQSITPLQRMRAYNRQAHSGIQPAGYFNTTDQSYPGQAIRIDPGQKLTFEKKGYCMDPGIPAPHKGESFALHPVKDRIPSEMMPIYEGIMEASKTDREVKSQLQDLVWGLRTANKTGDTRADRVITTGKLGLYDRAYPGATDDFLRFRQSHKSDIFSSITDQLKAGLQDQAEDRIGDTIDSGLASGPGQMSSDELLSKMQKMDPQGKMKPNAQYSTLAPGVVAKTEGTGMLKIRSEIVNTSDTPFYFNPTEWTASPSRDVQGVSIPPLSKSDFNVSDVPARPRDYTPAERKEVAKLASDQASYLNDKKMYGFLDLAGMTGWDNESLEKTIHNNLSVGVAAETFKMTAENIPGVNLICAGYEAFRGRDWLTGKKLSTAERLVSAVGLIPGAAAVTDLAGSAFKVGTKMMGSRGEVLRKVTKKAVDNCVSPADKKFGSMALDKMKKFDGPSDTLDHLYSYPADKLKEDFRESKIYKSMMNDLKGKKDIQRYLPELKTA